MSNKPNRLILEWTDDDGAVKQRLSFDYLEFLEAMPKAFWENHGPGGDPPATGDAPSGDEALAFALVQHLRKQWEDLTNCTSRYLYEENKKLDGVPYLVHHSLL
jgi:hypothetical protein